MGWPAVMMMINRYRWRCLAIVVIPLIWPHVTASASSSQLRLSALREYLALVQGSTQDESRSIAELRATPREQLASAMTEMQTALATGHPLAPSRQTVERCVLLHTIAIISSTPMPDVERGWHLSLCERLLSLQDQGRQQVVSARFRRQWRLTMTWWSQGHLYLAEAERWLQNLERDSPDDEDVLLARGSLRELQAWNGLKRFGIVVPALRSQSEKPWQDAPARQSFLVEAEDVYRRCLKKCTTCPEVRLRLARIQYERGRSEEALSILKSPAFSMADPWLAYVRHLVRGAANQRLGLSHEAVVAYEAAHHLRPDLQVPSLALSHVLWETGDRTASRLAAIDALRNVEGEGADPWWEYYFGQSRLVPAGLEAMRRECGR